MPLRSPSPICSPLMPYQNQILTLDYVGPTGVPVRRTLDLGNELQCAKHDLDRWGWGATAPSALSHEGAPPVPAARLDIPRPPASTPPPPMPACASRRR